MLVNWKKMNNITALQIACEKLLFLFQVAAFGVDLKHPQPKKLKYSGVSFNVSILTHFNQHGLFILWFSLQ